MKRLKELRESLGFTQRNIADMLKTTQQTVARWESGAVEPNISALRDLAMVFNTSVDDLLGKNPFSEKVTSNYYCLFKEIENVDGFWGHLGLLLPGQEQTKWFPITLDTMKRISSSLQSFDEKTQWICAHTLNNRVIAFDPQKMRRIWLLDEACDAPDDWSDEICREYSGEPLEFYKALDEYISEDGETENISDTLRGAIEDYLKEHNSDEEKIHNFLHHTTIFMVDGTTAAYWAEPENLYDLAFHVDLEAVPAMISLPAMDRDFESYYPSHRVVAVDMPLLDVMSAAKKDMDNYED